MLQKETLLRLLLLNDTLDTSDAWAAALNDIMDEDKRNPEVLQSGNPQSLTLVEAIGAIVPNLPDYRALSSKLAALMTYCNQSDGLVRSWLQRTPPHSSVPFRRWIVHDYLKCSHLTSVGPKELLHWKHALFVAAVNEPVKTLRRKLLQYVAVVDEAYQGRCGDGKDEELVLRFKLMEIDTVEGFLDFCWLHAEQLATCSLLCAAKLHAIAVKTHRGPAILAGCDDVMVRLRWSVTLKPLLFKPLVQYAIALKVLPGDLDLSFKAS